MSNLITTTEIQGGAVYGVAQMSYAVNGEPVRDYSAALAAAAFRQSVAIEDATAAYAAVVRQREKKVSDLGNVLTALTQALATMDPKSQDKNKLSDKTTYVYQAKLTAALYNIPFTVSTQSTDDSGVTKAAITYANAMTAQNEVQYRLDLEDNELQQDLVSLQSFVSKRDNAYSTAAKIIKKSDGAASSTISNMN